MCPGVKYPGAYYREYKSMNKRNILREKLKIAKQILTLYKSTPKGKISAEIMKARIYLAERAIEDGNDERIDKCIKCLELIV